MKKEFYYIYCKGVLGVKTNKANFKWVYGSAAPLASFEEYKECAVKLDLCIKEERELGNNNCYDKRFQAYTWNSKTKTVYCRRTLLNCLKIGFNIRVDGNTVYAEVGRNYYRLVQNRTMNLHGAYYLLADLINVILLKNGFLSLYASAVYSAAHKRCVACFAPPNTGKSLTASNLCKHFGYMLIGEDIVITDTKKVYACPWTLSYRKPSAVMDDAGSLGRAGKVANVETCEACDLTDLAVLSLGKRRGSAEKEDILQQIHILNGYLFGYYSTPIVKILAYFDEEYRKHWNDYAETMLEDMMLHCNCCLIHADAPIEFYKLANFEKTGEEHESFGNYEKRLG